MMELMLLVEAEAGGKAWGPELLSATGLEGVLTTGTLSSPKLWPTLALWEAVT